MRYALASIVLAIWACGAPHVLRADEPATEAAPKERRAARAKNPVTRADLAAAYLRFELALRAHPPAADQVAEINQDFDRATLAFFSGNSAKTIETINALVHRLAGDAPNAAARGAESLKVAFDPLVLVLGGPKPPVAKLLSMYAVENAGASWPLRLELRRVGESMAVRSLEFQATPDADGKVALTLDLSPIAADLPPATYEVALVGIDVPAIQIARWSVVPRSLDAVRAENAQRLEKLQAALPVDQSALAEALASCQARNELLTDNPSEANTAQYLADPNRLAAEIAQEIAALERQCDPYRRRAGNYWRVVTTARRPIPLRVYAPTAVTSDQPAPLVIALHGAGGDENMFLEGYGAGVIKELADRHGFLVASPATNSLGSKTEQFDHFVDALAFDYAIDRKRIYVLGHSMGGMATSLIAHNCGDRLRAAACMAGSGNFKTDCKLPPMLVIAGGLDMVVPRQRIEPGAQQAIADGLPIEYRLKESYGHTVLVGAVLPEVVDWLLTRP